VTELAITVVGQDRPGIIAEVSGVLADLGLNLTDSTMTLLRGHFAMTLICTGLARPEPVESVLAPLGLAVTVREVAEEIAGPPAGPGYLLTVYGADRLGIVAAVTRALADAGGNITDLTTRLAGELYLLVAEVDLPSTVDVPALTRELSVIAGSLGVEASLRPAEPEVL
jgi:glycine cleavage system transcriptional repressor